MNKAKDECLDDLIQAVESTLTDLITYQKKRVFKVAHELNSSLTPEDLRNPQDIPVLYRDTLFNYEDGILTGYLSAQTALRAQFNRMKPENLLINHESPT